MTHPDELELADFVDGSLPGEERGSVERHLATCETCAQDVRLARAGRAVATSLPPIEAPDTVGRPALEELKGGLRPAVARPRWERPLAAIAAVAAIVVAVAVVAPKLGSSQNDTGLAAAADTNSNSATPPVGFSSEAAKTIERQDVDYGPASLGELAGREFSATSPQPQATQGVDSAATSPPACVLADPPPGSSLVRVIVARFEGARAWIVVYTEGSDGADAGRVVVRALSRRTCDVLATAGAP